MSSNVNRRGRMAIAAFDWLGTRLRILRSRLELSAMNDRELADIGLTRHAIDRR